MTARVDCVVVGAGVVGLAVARQFAMSGREVLLLEAAGDIGTETSSRNSEVIHAGIYYPAGSQKAALCCPGKEMLYAYCADRGVDHKRCGKLIVATDTTQIPDLQQILEAGRTNGVSDLVWLSGNEVAMKQPALKASAAIWSPSTGIFDSHQLMLALLADVEAHGGATSFHTKVTNISNTTGELVLTVDDNDTPYRVAANSIINCAGIGAVPLARSIQGLPKASIPSVEFAKGSYFSYMGQTPFDCLVYPVPTPGGLGIHLTLDQAGQARFGPDVEWVDEINYDVKASARSKFAEAVASYWPAVQPERLSPAYSGIRVKTRPPGRSYHDFIFSCPKQHGIEGLLNMFGFESPGLTSCLAIGQRALNFLKP